MLFAVMPLIQGCATMEMWTFLPSSESSDPAVAGIVPAGAAASEVGSYLMVQYTPAHAAQSYFLVPLDSRGAAQPPFGYEGLARDPRAILDSISRERLSRIAASPLTPAGHSPCVGILVDPSGKPFAGLNARWNRNLDTGGVSAICYKVRANGSVEVIPYPDPSGPQVVPEGYRVAILPRSQPRPAAQVAREHAVFILLTPLTLAADAVIVPVGIVLVLTGIMPIKC